MSVTDSMDEKGMHRMTPLETRLKQASTFKATIFLQPCSNSNAEKYPKVHIFNMCKVRLSREGGGKGGTQVAGKKMRT
jgi:hypothetical protein